MREHQGGCLCGDIRYQTNGDPEITAVCHCRYCQLRTGSAFSTFVYFEQTQFILLKGALKIFDFVSESGGKWETRFCQRCGTTIACVLEVRPGLIGVSGGTFDPPTFWYALTREVFQRSKASFVGKIRARQHHSTMTSYNPVVSETPRKRGG